MTRFYTDTIMVPVDHIEPNPWNPNEMEEQTTAALTRILEHYGLFGGIPARQITDKKGKPTDRYQIIDGEQRFKRLVAAGNREAPLTLIPNLSEDDARTLTLALNNLRGEHDIVKLAAVFAAISDPSLLIQYAGYTPEYLGQFAIAGQEDWQELLAAVESTSKTALLGVVHLSFTFDRAVGEKLRTAMTLTAATHHFESDEEVLIYWATQAGDLTLPAKRKTVRKNGH